MKKTKIIAISSGILLLAAATSPSSSAPNNVQSKQAKSTETVTSSTQAPKPAKSTATAKKTVKTKPKPKPKPTCDGTKVTKNCVFENITYKTYVYHPAVAAKTHTEQDITYEKQVTSYCTLCQDGTYSPSCATGRGACSHHGGVAQWNAPVYRNVPITTARTVVDSPAKADYYEKKTQ